MMDQLYFIGLLPPADIRKEITEFKQYFLEKFGVRHAMKSPPHITLVPPFKWPEANEKQLTSALDRFASNEHNFPVVFENFGSFPPRVIFVDVRKNEPLEILYRKLTEYLSGEWNLLPDKNPGRPYHAHVTIAFKDLMKHQYNEAWPGFRDRKVMYEFTAGGITLLKHSGKQWEIYYLASFKN